MFDSWNIRGRWENWKIGDKNAADSAMPECGKANLASIPESSIKPMPKTDIRGIQIPDHVLASLESNKGCAPIFGRIVTKQ